MRAIHMVSLHDPASEFLQDDTEAMEVDVMTPRLISAKAA